MYQLLILLLSLSNPFSCLMPAKLSSQSGEVIFLLHSGLKWQSISPSCLVRLCSWHEQLHETATQAFIVLKERIQWACNNHEAVVQVLLAAAVKDASKPILELPVLSQEDAGVILEGFNSKQSEIPDTCLHNLFEQQADRQPSAPCVRTPQETLSYGQVEQRANALAHVLQSKGVGSGSAVGVMMDRDPSLYVAILAVLKAGAAYLPMDSGYPEDRLKFMASDAAIQVLITSKSLAGAVASVEAEVLNAFPPIPDLPCGSSMSQAAHVSDT